LARHSHGFSQIIVRRAMMKADVNLSYGDPDIQHHGPAAHSPKERANARGYFPDIFSKELPATMELIAVTLLPVSRNLERHACLTSSASNRL
jgi:hypothetical protein